MPTQLHTGSPVFSTSPISENNWNLPHTDDYGQACDLGRVYARDFILFIREDPEWSGSNMLGRMARDIDFNDEVHWIVPLLAA
ncbi:hypothetical protein [Solemya velum gill symbiont]|nr:hypothetical protein [Solemya velum gill symbiont]OOZ44257.1 hypothetical protein BOW37_07710 [Solemya velum gill symbiont]OOZ48022.1 hypothetical protein BOW38_00735 [Solemya velum gill symbiont]OOZ51043.1 hypothetical protein BOW39_00010 [Solemya velum gill symbiont]OOZ52964.1 hypothetical protein BOW40_00735 [Solemya velum gill symbiont]OOZ55603.1 hypothetical protein BOW42_09545 [Solemya velum gill symbiont]